MRRWQALAWHVFALIALSAFHVFVLAERLLDLFLPDSHQVEHWITVVSVGIGLIAMGCLVSLILFLRR